MFYVYVLQSDLDSGLYIGFSRNLRRRFSEHQSGGVQSTKHRCPWVLIYYEAYMQVQDAEGREQFLKSGAGRQFLKKQLRNHFRANPLSGSQARDA